MTLTNIILAIFVFTAIFVPDLLVESIASAFEFAVSLL